MARAQNRPQRKKSGGRYRPMYKKKLQELGGQMIEVAPGEKKVKVVRGRGATTKRRAFQLKEANVLNSKTKKFEKTEIVSVKENTANQHYVRRNTITKGAIIETKAGLAKVTNRPAQEGFINALLVEEEK